MLFCLVLLFVFNVCVSEKSDLGFGLTIGNAIDVFANYGDLSQVTQVVSADYEEEEREEPSIPFSEKNIRVFANASSTENEWESLLVSNLDILLCDSFEDLLQQYFSNFIIEGTNKPWKAFMGDWILDEIMRTLGIFYDGKPDNCCYVLVRLTKKHKSEKLGDLQDVTVKDYVRRASENLNVSDPSEVRRFMKSYGTHYIESYVTGNFIYQVFKYKQSWYQGFKAKIRNGLATGSRNLRFYFSSYFLTQIGDIRVASGNKTVEAWAKRNLRDGQYLYSRPSLLRLHYSPMLTYKINHMLDNGALLGLGLKTLRPLFKDHRKGEKYAEIVENDLLLWEVNA